MLGPSRIHLADLRSVASWRHPAPHAAALPPLLTLSAYTTDKPQVRLGAPRRPGCPRAAQRRVILILGATVLSDLIPSLFGSKGTTIPVLRLTGTIGAVTPLRQGLSLAACATAIDRAFGIKNAPAVAIQINSPGGSPVQSRLIYERIRSLAT